MPAPELWEIQDAVVARIEAEVPDVHPRAADVLGQSDRSWLVQQPPSVLVACFVETPADGFRQPIGHCKVMDDTIELIYCFSGMRPREENRTQLGHPLIASVRDALWYYRIPDTMAPIDYHGIVDPDYDEKRRLLYIRQLFSVRVKREAIL